MAILTHLLGLTGEGGGEVLTVLSLLVGTGDAIAPCAVVGKGYGILCTGAIGGRDGAFKAQTIFCGNRDTSRG